MSWKSWLAKPFAKSVASQYGVWNKNAVSIQENLLLKLVEKAKNTQFGKDHQFEDIQNHEAFKRLVPVRDYEGLKPYVDQTIAGKSDQLWAGKPIYFAKTSGTTSGSKYIPITKASVPNHINSARNALLLYINRTKNTAFVDGKMIFLSGSPVLDKTGGILTGRLSGIVNHHVPGYLRKNQMPDYQTNCIEDWEEKLDAIVEQTIQEDMRLISGIPPWMQMYFDRLQKKAGKPVGEIFPNLSLIVHGGVNFSPYRDKLLESIGRPVDMIETYPASEGFIAFQDGDEEDGLLLNVNSGIFYEFIPVNQYHDENPPRLNLGEIEEGENYALIISSNAGLWAYNIGDTVRIISKDPFRIKVTGRIKQFISAFGEHVIAEEIEESLKKALVQHPARIKEFTVAPIVTPDKGLPHHQWLMEFETLPEDLEGFAESIDYYLRRKNSYYEDLITGNILKTLEIIPLKENAFLDYLRSKGKLGGQNKVPRMSNDRTVVDDLIKYQLPNNMS